MLGVKASHFILFLGWVAAVALKSFVWAIFCGAAFLFHELSPPFPLLRGVRGVRIPRCPSAISQPVTWALVLIPQPGSLSRALSIFPAPNKLLLK